MSLYQDIMAGDTVYFKTPHTAELKGRAVMHGPSGWVVNFGRGMPAVVSEKNFIKLRKGRNRKPDYFGKFLNG